MVMFYKPHTLQVETFTVTNDHLGVATKSEAAWTTIAPCRCDHDTTADLSTDAGQTYKSKWHVVAEKADGIREGDKMRCVDRDGNEVGSGVVRILKRSNVFELMEMWV